MVQKDQNRNEWKMPLERRFLSAFRKGRGLNIAFLRNERPKTQTEEAGLGIENRYANDVGLSPSERISSKEGSALGHSTCLN